MRTARLVALAITLGAALAPGGLALPAGASAPQCRGRNATIVGTGRSEVLRGTRASDVIVGRGGGDFIRGARGRDVICGNRGNDTLNGGRAGDVIAGGRGFDTASGGAGRDRIFGGGRFDSLGGGKGDDRLIGGRSSDALRPGLGDDVLRAGPGDSDVAEFFARTDRGVTASLRTRTARGHGRDRLRSIEGLIGTRFDDTLIGNAKSNFALGLRGDDVIRGRGNPEGTFRVDFLVGNAGSDDIFGGAGKDLAEYADATRGVTVDLAEGTARGRGRDTLRGVEYVEGSRFDDDLTGDEEDNGFLGGRGADTMAGAGGRDFVDFFFATGNGVTADLSADTARGEGRDDLVEIEDLFGSFENDDFTGDNGPNRLAGLFGDDELTGLAGNDRLIGGAGTDTADGGAGNDLCRAEDRSDSCESSGRSALLEARASLLRTARRLALRAASPRR